MQASAQRGALLTDERGSPAAYRWLIDYEPALPGVFVSGRDLIALAIAEFVCAIFLALPPVAHALGISSRAAILIVAAHFSAMLLGSALFRERSKDSPSIFYLAVTFNLFAGLAASCAIPVLSGDPRSIAWALPIVYAALNGGLPETRPSYLILIAHLLAPLLTIPFFRDAPGTEAFAGPLLAAGISGGIYHYTAMRTADWRTLRARHEEALLTIREQEDELARARLAQDLHDSVGSTLSLLHLHAELLEKSGGDPERAAELALLAREATRTGLNDLRSVLEALSPADEPLSALVDSMRELARFTAPGIKVEIVMNDEGGARSMNAPLHVKERLILLRIFQESLRNAVVHGGAEHFFFTIVLDEGLSFEARDDGKGFDPAAIKRGRGLAGMRARIEELGGSFTLSSRLGGGTILSATLRQNTEQNTKLGAKKNDRDMSA